MAESTKAQGHPVPTGVIVFGALGGFALLVGAVVGLRIQSERTTQAAIDQGHAAASALQRQAPAPNASITRSRLDSLDGECAGKGKPPRGFRFAGATYAQNEAVASGAGCVRFGPSGVDNVGNMFCCPAP